MLVRSVVLACLVLAPVSAAVPAEAKDRKPAKRLAQKIKRPAPLPSPAREEPRPDTSRQKVRCPQLSVEEPGLKLQALGPRKGCAGA